MVGTGILSNNTRSPSPECYIVHDILDDDHLQSVIHWSGITQIFDHITDLDLITEFDFLPICERFP